MLNWFVPPTQIALLNQMDIYICVFLVLYMKKCPQVVSKSWKSLQLLNIVIRKLTYETAGTYWTFKSHQSIPEAAVQLEEWIHDLNQQIKNYKVQKFARPYLRANYVASSTWRSLQIMKILLLLIHLVQITLTQSISTSVTFTSATKNLKSKNSREIHLHASHVASSTWTRLWQICCTLAPITIITEAVKSGQWNNDFNQHTKTSEVEISVRPNVCRCYSVTFLNRTSTFDRCVVRWG